VQSSRCTLLYPLQLSRIANKRKVNSATPLPSTGKRKVMFSACSAILHLVLAVEGELSATSATITSPQRQPQFEASLKGHRSEVHFADFEP